MLREAGILGWGLVVALIVRELGRVFQWSLTVQIVVFAVTVIGYGAYVQALGRPLFFFLALIMMPLATTELGTDSWITPLLASEMMAHSWHPGWVLVYTALIMMILRFFAGAIVHRLSPLGLLAVSSLLAAVGLYSLSCSSGLYILIAAAVYGFGKTFFWPAMLGTVSEQIPRGGALTLNSISAVGMLSVGVLGNPFLGFVQDKHLDTTLRERNQPLHERVIDAEPKLSVFGQYSSLDPGKVAAVSEPERGQIQEVQEEARKVVLRRASIFPIVMLLCYLALILYFNSRGGYRPAVIGVDEDEGVFLDDGDDDLRIGGVG
jgi:MFS family permease